MEFLHSITEIHIGQNSTTCLKKSVSSNYDQKSVYILIVKATNTFIKRKNK